MKMIKKLILILGILIKVLIDTIFGLSLVLLMTIIGFISKFIYEQIKILYLSIKEIILE
jgi:hypothetical protein